MAPTALAKYDTKHANQAQKVAVSCVPKWRATAQPLIKIHIYRISITYDPRG